MASISLPAALPASFNSPFDSLPEMPPRPTSSTHTRKYSRNPNATPLPTFSFNPGVASVSPDEPSEAIKPTAETMPTQAEPRRAPRPPPLPDFKFNPGSEVMVDSTPSPTHPILEEMAQNQHRNSRSARPAPLPAFTFAPNTGVPQPSPSPTRTSFGDGTGSLRAGGHRRRGSEFVGGGAEGSHLISTSPQKGETKAHGPPVTGFLPRGHVHRRSQAISISDIDTSDLIKANAVSKHRSGSTPTTPSDISQVPPFSRNSPQVRQSISHLPVSPSSSPRRRGSAPGVRPRVGFSDHVDVIPRPLSLISSDTEGSTSTIRGNHSMSPSINSIATSPTPRSTPAIAAPFDNGSPKQRPQTADAAGLTTSGASGVMGAVSLPKRPLSASGSPAFTTSGSPPTKKKFWFSHSNESSPSPTPIIERSDPMSGLTTFAPTEAVESPRPKTSPERTASIKKRKARSWANGIFSRKARHRPSKAKGKRTPTPPTLMRRTSDQMNDIFDADDTIVIRNPSPVNRRGSAPILQTHFATTLPPAPVQDRDNQITSPVIDLDAALGPFGSEEKFGGNASSRRPAAKIAKLHSSERRGMADAFGTVHRRADSAPQMQRVDRSTFGMHRMGSNTSLVGDVFDEEEEDNYLAGAEADGVSVTSLITTEANDTSVTTPDSAKTSLSKAEHECSSSVEGLGFAVSVPADDSVVIVDADDNIGIDTTRASMSTIQAPILTEADLQKRPASSPMSFAYPTTQSHYASSTEGRTATNSLISSPDADHVSFDQPRRVTRYLGEPSPEMSLRASNDDLPSLTDSISTGAVPRFSSSTNTRCSVEQRSASVSDPVAQKPNNAWKRASLASLNRLIPGSSYGSRLKFETIPDPAEEEKTKKKGNRLSKLMHFWRSKEKAEK